jgi:hypothetical protein
MSAVIQVTHHVIQTHDIRYPELQVLSDGKARDESVLMKVIKVITILVVKFSSLGANEQADLQPKWHAMFYIPYASPSYFIQSSYSLHTLNEISDVTSISFPKSITSPTYTDPHDAMLWCFELNR